MILIYCLSNYFFFYSFLFLSFLFILNIFYSFFRFALKKSAAGPVGTMAGAPPSGSLMGLEAVCLTPTPSSDSELEDPVASWYARID